MLSAEKWNWKKTRDAFKEANSTSLFKSPRQCLTLQNGRPKEQWQAFAIEFLDRPTN